MAQGWNPEELHMLLSLELTGGHLHCSIEAIPQVRAEEQKLVILHTIAIQFIQQHFMVNSIKGFSNVKENY